MEIKKLFKSGNSVVVAIGTLGQEWLEAKVGDLVVIQCMPGRVIQVKKISDVVRKVAEKQEGDDE